MRTPPLIVTLIWLFWICLVASASGVRGPRSLSFNRKYLWFSETGWANPPLAHLFSGRRTESLPTRAPPRVLVGAPAFFPHYFYPSMRFQFFSFSHCPQDPPCSPPPGCPFLGTLHTSPRAPAQSTSPSVEVFFFSNSSSSGCPLLVFDYCCVPFQRCPCPRFPCVSLVPYILVHSTFDCSPYRIFTLGPSFCSFVCCVSPPLLRLP